MHWALGEEEMARRAHELSSHSEQSRSFEEIAETIPESSYNAPGTEPFEGYRVHHFNATRPPQVQLPMPVTSQPIKATARQATLPSILNVDLDRSASSITGKNGEASLTVEGKRQVSPRVLSSRYLYSKQLTCGIRHKLQVTNYERGQHCHAIEKVLLQSIAIKTDGRIISHRHQHSLPKRLPACLKPSMDLA